MADDSATNLNPDFKQQGFAAVDDTTEVPTTMSGTQGILDRTLGEVLQSNPQAQQLIMQSMHLTPEKFQEMLATAQKDNLMHMKIRDLFNQGFVQQAISQQQGQEIITDQPQIENVDGVQDSSIQSSPQKPSFLQQIKNLFK